MTSPDRELVPYIALNNSSVGYTTTSTHGNCWRTEYHPNTIRFSAAGNPLIRERGLDNVYRYYSTYRTEYHPNTIRFSAAGNPLIRERGLDNVYRYYSTYRSKIF